MPPLRTQNDTVAAVGGRTTGATFDLSAPETIATALAGVGPVRRHGGEELVEGRGGGDDVDGTVVRQEGDGALADQVVILREDHADHARMVHAGIARRGVA